MRQNFFAASFSQVNCGLQLVTRTAGLSWTRGQVSVSGREPCAYCQGAKASGKCGRYGEASGGRSELESMVGLDGKTGNPQVLVLGARVVSRN